MRLIDADKFEFYTCVNKSSDYVDGVQSMLEAIDRSPTIDAVPVVRCKDCVHSYDDLCGLCCTCGPYVDCVVQPEFYCADGKRKENSNDLG